MIHNILYIIAMIGFPIMHYIIIMTFTRETLRIYYYIATGTCYLLFILCNNNNNKNDSNINILRNNIYRMIHLTIIISKTLKCLKIFILHNFKSLKNNIFHYFLLVSLTSWHNSQWYHAFLIHCSIVEQFLEYFDV